MKRTPKSIMMFLAAASMILACKGQNSSRTVRKQIGATLQKADSHALPEEWYELTERDRFMLRMPYAGTGNFTRQKIYDCARCLLRPEVAKALMQANKTAVKGGLKIVIYDAYRPLPYQQKMYDVVPDKRYVADPRKGSMHNRGCAADVGLADSLGILLDMGTGFDDFSEKAAYSFPDLTEKQKENRTMLRKLMTDAGFSPYEHEWWHFNYKKKNYPLSDYVWPCN